MKKLVLLFSLVAVFFSQSVAAPEKKSFVIAQKDSPILLGNKGFRVEENRSIDSVIANAEYTNKSTKTITALSLGFIFYGPFDNQLESRGGLDLRDRSNLDPGDKDTGTWEFNFTGDFSTTTMIVFVNIVRFSDGTIWKADPKELDTAIRALTGSAFDPASLK
jgi:hypothetical protein